MKKLSRSTTSSFAFGQPGVLPNSKLPLEIEVYNAFVQESVRVRQNKQRNTSQRKIVYNVAIAVKNVWLMASLSDKE